MFVPTNLLPSALGLTWGMPKEECLHLLRGDVSKDQESYTLMLLAFDGERVEVELRYDNRQELTRINAYLMISEEFWHSGEDEVKIVEEVFEQHYHEAVAECVSFIGPPTFSGTQGESLYPESEIAWMIAYWNIDGDRLQIELDHPDKEVPVYVALSCYPIEVSS